MSQADDKVNVTANTATAWPDILLTRIGVMTYLTPQFKVLDKAACKQLSEVFEHCLQEQEKRRTIALARSAYLSLEADIAQVKARKQAVISTQTSLDATTAGYDAGTRTSVDVLLSQRLLYSSQRDYAVARHSYITDSLELKRVAGTLTITDIEEINKWLIPRPAQKQ